jgi:hypothetical protein
LQFRKVFAVSEPNNVSKILNKSLGVWILMCFLFVRRGSDLVIISKLWKVRDELKGSEFSFLSLDNLAKRIGIAK